ncbi:hypothetical protein SARC_04890 [Sphaeroforma arctica JP610]|uniref:Uncharacterized protein n=1 Tax=Sphaeroforma arctica JP610 TaxID=667725 RepID=A0A0L0G3Q5_9EUKA|nr:hypothetical protein SARC_04890 [Sphaeroforma arctica JP610]KNC82843.1 hypothetical protein SARC_04890 [Sphaeroforma arctica JP610]|eukprot:XP_014156745.1 hypothetical protein SARC_04890 [Sphaeroforma arctica JP610]
MGKKTKFIGLLWCVAAVTLLMHFGVKFDFSLNAADVVTNADESARQQVEQFHQYTDNNINQQQVFQGKDDHDAKSATPNADTDPADVAGNNVDTLEEKQPMPESLPNQPIPGRAPHQPFEPDMDELRIKPPEEHEFSGKNGVLDVKALLKAQQRQEKYEDEELERRLRTRGVNLDSVSDRNQDIKGDNDEGSPDEKVPETIESNEDRVSDNNRNSHNAGDRNFATENVGVRGHRLLYFGDEDNVERPNQAIFHQIYTNNVWEPDHADGGTGSKGGGGSGEGSDPDLIVNLPEILDTVVLDYNVTRLLDAEVAFP